jgi:Holliday junction resolvase RusA-like endonuclease
MKITLRVYGDPAPQGSKRVFNGRVVEAAGDKLKRWRKAIAAECQRAKEESPEVFFTGAVVVEAKFFMPRPASVTQKKRPLPIVPPDLDKLARGLLDGIGQSEVIWGDDSQVVTLIAHKVYADLDNQGVTVTITALDNNSVTTLDI